MSLGATIAHAVRSGTTVEILTVFGYGPTSNAPAGPWDTKSGYRTEAQACRARRAEDGNACRILGATPRWLDFGAEPYERRGTPAEILAAVTDAIQGKDAVLIPGYPLAHPDHAELSQLLLGGRFASRVGLYAEQPYRFWERRRRDQTMRAAPVDELLTARLTWVRQPVGRPERLLKLEAVRCYRSQLRQLGLGRLGLHRMLWHERMQGGELIAWLS